MKEFKKYGGKMKNYLLIIVVMLIMILASSCYIETTSRSHRVRFPLLAHPSNDQFDSITGQRMWSNEPINVAFVNNSSGSFTIAMTYVIDQYYSYSRIIYPGKYALFTNIPSGEYGLSIKRGPGYTYTNKIIVWDEGDFDINGQIVDVKIDLDTLWCQCGGGGDGGEGKYKF